MSTFESTAPVDSVAVPESHPRRSPESLKAYERTVAKPLFIVLLAYLVVVYLEILPGLHIGPVLVIMDGAFWLVFVIDYVVRVGFLAPQPLRYALKWECILDFIVVLSFPVLLFAHTGAFGFARVLRLVRVGAQLGRVGGEARRVFTRRSLRWVAPLAVMIAVLAAIYVWQAEELHADATIHGPGDAIWWAFVTMLTVGYGDTYPHSAGGKIAAVILMLVGITVVGWLTAALASMFVEHDQEAVVEAVVEAAVEATEGAVVEAAVEAAVEATEEAGEGRRSRVEELERLAALHDRDKLTEDEFAAFKAKLLS